MTNQPSSFSIRKQKLARAKLRFEHQYAEDLQPTYVCKINDIEAALDHVGRARVLELYEKFDLHTVLLFTEAYVASTYKFNPEEVIDFVDLHINPLLHKKIS